MNRKVMITGLVIGIFSFIPFTQSFGFHINVDSLRADTTYRHKLNVEYARIREEMKAHEVVDSITIAEAIQKHAILLDPSMNTDDVLKSWGAPTKIGGKSKDLYINIFGTKDYRINEHWIYKNTYISKDGVRKYELGSVIHLYFEGNVLTSWEWEEKL